MPYRYRSEYAEMLRAEGEAKGRAEGRVRGMANALLRLLEIREICVSPDERDRIMACTDQETIEIWLDRATVAETTSEVFG